MEVGGDELADFLERLVPRRLDRLEVEEHVGVCIELHGRCEVVLFGGVGYALDLWRGTSPGFLLGGLLLGLVVGFYDLAKTVFGSKK